MPRVITLGEGLSRCEGCGWGSGGSPGPWITGGGCSASEASVQHLWTEWCPTCSQISAVWFLLGFFFFSFLNSPPASYSPRSARFMRKAPPSYSHLPLPGWAPRVVWAWSATWDMAWPGLRSTLLKHPQSRPCTFGAQPPLANSKTHRWFIIPSFFPLTKHRAHIWRLPLDPFILFRGPGTAAESDWYRLNSYPTYCEQPFVFMKSKYLPLRWASTAYQHPHWKLKCW